MTTLREKTAITGVGETKYSRNSGTTALALQLEASLNAIADAGLSVRCKITRSISHLGMRDRWYSSTRRGTSVVRCSRVQARDRRFADPWDKCPHRYGS